MATIYYDTDADRSALSGRRIGVIGYGSQGHAHALNLKDSGHEVTVGLRKDSPSWKEAEAAGLTVRETAAAASDSDIVMMLVPDQKGAAIYAEEIEPQLSAGNALGFAHGFNIHFDRITPPSGVDVFLVAPKGPGHLLRRTFLEGEGTPALVAVGEDATGKAKQIALAYAQGIGATRAGVIETTFAEETETDLFGEQAVLCGGLTRLIQAGFETLVEAGYQPEVAYFECLHEMKLIVDLIYEGGLARMRHSISDTAEYGDLTRGDRIVGDLQKQEMKKLLEEVKSGAFAKEWVSEADAGYPSFAKLRREAAAHPIEEVGSRLREMMSWLNK